MHRTLRQHQTSWEGAREGFLKKGRKPSRPMMGASQKHEYMWEKRGVLGPQNTQDKGEMGETELKRRVVESPHASKATCVFLS